MSKKTVFLFVALLSTQTAGCTSIQNYIFKPIEAKTTELILQYNFIEPRRSALQSKITAKLKHSNQNRYNYYSASGYNCTILSLQSRKSACNIEGQWRELAPILNTSQP